MIIETASMITKTVIVLWETLYITRARYLRKYLDSKEATFRKDKVIYLLVQFFVLTINIEYMAHDRVASFTFFRTSLFSNIYNHEFFQS